MDTGEYSLQVLCVVLVQLVTILHVSAQRTRSGVCGSIPNNPSTTICCNGLVYVRSGAQPGCCGSVGYDARNYLCCSENIVRKDQYKMPRCCGRHGYDRMKDNCIGGKRLQKKTNLGSHCCMTDSGWKCCNKGETCCSSYTGSGQVEITGFRPVCCEKGSFREKAECCANIMETTAILPSCCQTQDLKPKCCNRWDGSTECCPGFGTCCGNNIGSNPGGRRGVPIRRDPVRPTPPMPTQPYYKPAAYYTTKKAFWVPQCCLAFQNRPSCCRSLYIHPDCCRSRQQSPDRDSISNQVSRSQQLPSNRRYCCTSTRRTCCPKIASARVSKVSMQPCCYSSNKPACCYTSQAYSTECCKMDPVRNQSSYILPAPTKDANQALEVKYSGGRGELPAQTGNRNRGVPVIPGYGSNIKESGGSGGSNKLGGSRTRGRENPGSNRWTDKTRTNGGYDNIIDSDNRNRGLPISPGYGDDIKGAGDLSGSKFVGGGVLENQGSRGWTYNTRTNGRYNTGGSNRWTGSRGYNVNESNRWTNEIKYDQGERRDKVDQNGGRQERPVGPNENLYKQTTTTTTERSADSLQETINQNDVLAYEYCCYLMDRRTCCKEAYMATGTLPYCCSASIEKENMGSNKMTEWSARGRESPAPSPQAKIKIAQPEPEPKFIPEYAPFGSNEYVLSGIVNEISVNEIPGFNDWDTKPVSERNTGSSKSNMPNIIKAIIVESRHPTTKDPKESEMVSHKQVTVDGFKQPEILFPDLEDDKQRKLENGNTYDMTQIPDITGGLGIPEVPAKNQNQDKLEQDHRPGENEDDLTLDKTTKDAILSEKEDAIEPLPTVFPVVDFSKTGDTPGPPYVYPALNDSIYAPSNIIGQPADADVINTKDNSSNKIDVSEPTVSTAQTTNVPGWSHKNNIPFENEYQQPDTLDNPFPYIPSANDIRSPDIPTEDPAAQVLYPIPDYDSVDPHLKSEIYNYYPEGGEYPEYMMCGDEPYMMNVYICCDGVLRYRYGVRPRCCGTEAYDDFTYKCCDGVIMRSCDPGYQPHKTVSG